MFSLITLLSGASGGLVSSMIFWPFETIEARQQLDPRISSRKVWDALRHILKTEGPVGLYIAWQVGVPGVGLNWAIYFTLYEALLAHVSGGSVLPPHVQLLVGMVVGCFTCTIVNPFWVVKYRMVSMYAKKASDKGQCEETTPFEVVQEILKGEDGLKQLYAGLVPSWCGSLTGALQFVFYAIFKTMFGITTSDSFTSSLLIFLSGCIASFIATAITYPHLVVRSRMQVAKGLGPVQCVQNLYRDGGLGAFYKGLDTNLIRSVPTSGTRFLVKETTSLLLTSILA